MSSPRSRSGGRRSRITARRKYRSRRKRSRSDSRSRSRLVAARMRTSIFRSRIPPTRRTVRSSTALSSLPCSDSSMSPTSSRNRKPPSAASKRPILDSFASVNAPALVAEQLGLHQRRRQGGAIHLDEGLGRARAGRVNGAGHESLPGAGFAGDEHRRGLVQRGDLPGLLQHAPNGRRLADHLGERARRSPRAAGSTRAPA